MPFRSLMLKVPFYKAFVGSRVERSAPCYRVRPPPHRTVRAGFPHTAFRVGLVSSVSLPFASRLRFTLIPMDAPPYGRAVSDAPPHSGLSPIAVFRHYSSRHLICIVPFFTQRPFASTGIAPLPRYYDLVRLLRSLSLVAVLPSSLAELSGSAAPFAPPRPPCPNRVSKAMLASRPQRR